MRLTDEELKEFYAQRVRNSVEIFRRVGLLGMTVVLALSGLEFVFSKPYLPGALLLRLAVIATVLANLSTVKPDDSDLQFDRRVIRHCLIILLVSCFGYSQVPPLYYFALPAQTQVLLLAALTLARSSRTPWLLSGVLLVESAFWWMGVPPRALLVHTLSTLFGLGIAWFAASWIERARLVQFTLEKQLEREASTDALTGAYNRRSLIRLAQDELTRAERYGRPLSALMLDIDHFKKINDQFGHDVGDQAICQVAEVCSTTVRTSDRVGRWGGEEFVVLLPETALTDALVLAERLRLALADSQLACQGGPLSMTLSCGVAEWRSGMHWEELLKGADEALYEAKESGRNRVCCKS